MLKSITTLCAATFLFAACNTTTSNNCATATDSMQHELVVKDQRITTLEDSLRNAMAMSKPAAGSDTAVLESSGSSTANTTTTNTNTTTSTNDKGNGNGSFYKTTTVKHASLSKDLRSKYPGEFPEGSAKVLTDKDVKFLSRWGLKVMLNEIYARHGMKFSDNELQGHFSRQLWYHAKTDNVDNNLSNTERRNIEFIQNYKFTPDIPGGRP